MEHLKSHTCKAPSSSVDPFLHSPINQRAYDYTHGPVSEPQLTPTVGNTSGMLVTDPTLLV